VREEQEAKKALLEMEITKLKKDIAKVSDSLMTIEKIREDENKKYEQEKSNNLMSIGQMKQAVEVLQKSRGASTDGGQEANM